MNRDFEFVVVAVFADGVSGSVLATALESAGVPAQVRGGESSWLFPGAAGGLGAVEVLVPRRFLEDAEAIVAELHATDAGRRLGRRSEEV